MHRRLVGCHVARQDPQKLRCTREAQTPLSAAVNEEMQKK